jgi:hypothetical protein
MVSKESSCFIENSSTTVQNETYMYETAVSMTSSAHIKESPSADARFCMGKLRIVLYKADNWCWVSKMRDRLTVKTATAMYKGIRG